MKKVIVVGCNGQLGRAIMNELLANIQYEVLGFNSQQIDIANQQQVTDIISKISPYAVINCAAYTKVNDSEENLNQAYMVNALGARNLAIASNNACSKLVHISTDYVFDGKSNKPYTEFEKTNPLGIYAKTKLLGEEFIKTFSNKFFIFRTSGLYGNGKNFVNAILEQSRNKNEIQVVSDQTATPTSALELAKCISSMLETENYGLFHATCEGQCTWAEFAKEIVSIMDISVSIKDIKSSEYGSNVQRPAYSVLENYMLKLTNGYVFPDWKDALKEYLSNL